MKFLSLFFIILSVLSLVFNISHPPGLSGKSIQYYDNIETRIIFGILQLSIGIIIYIYSKKTFLKHKHSEYTKCPKCKEVFNYKDIKDGKCPNCEDVDTIDLDEYFKKYPDELDSK